MFVLHGRLHDAVQLLMQHEDSKSQAFKLIMHLMNRMPQFTVSIVCDLTSCIEQ